MKGGGTAEGMTSGNPVDSATSSGLRVVLIKEFDHLPLIHFMPHFDISSRGIQIIDRSHAYVSILKSEWFMESQTYRW